MMKIVIWTGSAWETWGDHSIDQGGIGGSETAAIRMAHALTGLGHTVELIGQHEPYTCEDGVRYIDYRPYVAGWSDGGVADIECDVFVSSRDKRALRLNPKTKLKVLWVHDIHCGDDWDNDLPRFDRIFCLSNWAKMTFGGHYPHVDSNKIELTRNGLHLPYFMKAITPSHFKENRFTYSSSPDRGLDKLLDFWPKIRSLFSGAELHVYYGFDNWKKMAVGRPADELRIAAFEKRLSDMEPQGVCYHGRASQREVVDSYFKSPLWVYPTNFKETYCITALEAQAAGAIPITTDIGALPETVKTGFLIPPFNGEPKYEAKLFEYLKYWQDLPVVARRSLAETAQIFAMGMSWVKVAADWARRFTEAIEK